MSRLTALVMSVVFGVLQGEFEADPQWLHVEISMEEDGFMCPFLTPMFLGILEDKGADWVICRPQLSEIEFCVPLEMGRSEAGYIDWLTGIGYQDQHIAFQRFDTLSVQPQVPAP